MAKSLLPYIMQDKNNLALENCMKQAFSVDAKQFLVYPLENAKEELLPYLAKELHTLGFEGWNFANTPELKRNLLANSLRNHFLKGTIPGIQQFLKTIGLDAEIQEWFEYGGRPARFRVFIESDSAIDQEAIDLLFQGISCYKNQRSIFDNVTVQMLLTDDKSVNAYIAIGLTEGIESTYICTQEL